MATVIDFDTCKKTVISWLQASRTAYPTAVDGSKLQFASDTEIANAILYSDGEICQLICTTAGHPYQNGFVITSSAMVSGDTLPSHNGMILRVLALNGDDTITMTSANATTDIFTVSGGHGFVQGQKIRFNNSGGAAPSPIVAVTRDYYVIYVSSTDFKVALTPFSASAGTNVNLTDTGTGTTTMTPQYVPAYQGKNRDEVLEMYEQGAVYKHDIATSNGLLPYFFIEGSKLYLSTVYGKVEYTDYTLDNAPLAPEPYTMAVCAGAVGRLLKDGGDDGMAAYYLQLFDQSKQMIAGGAQAIPVITAYKAGGAA